MSGFGMGGMCFGMAETLAKDNMGGDPDTEGVWRTFCAGRTGVFETWDKGTEESRV